MYDYPNYPQYSIRDIISDNWNKYKINHSELDPYIIREIERMLDCCNPNKGFFYGYCRYCKEEIKLHFKCNGKICSKCGKYYVDRWVEKAKKKVFPETHRLVTLTLPADLRPILKDKWDLLKIIQDSAHQTIQEVASKVWRKQVKVGMLIGLQTYGQDLKFHPHVHCMVLEQAKYKNQVIKFNFIPKEILRKTWQRVLLTNLTNAVDNLGDKRKINEMSEQYPNGFVTDVGKSSMNKSSVIRYLARYMRHPAISNSRIQYYGRDRVIIKLKDKLGREYHKLFTVDEFITALIQHIPPKQFRIVRWYGLYSRRNVRLERRQSKDRQETMSKYFNVKNRVIRCPYCKNPLDCVTYYPNGPPDDKELKEKLDYWIGLNN